jgi:hypothetical protein
VAWSCAALRDFVRGRPTVRPAPPPKARVLCDLINLGDLCAKSGRCTGTGGWSDPGSRPNSIALAGVG